MAIEIKTRNGHRDIVLMDGQPEKTRRIGDLQVAAEFAFYSTDRQGLRLATLHGGTDLRTADLRIHAAQRAYHGAILSVDYLKKQIALDTAWPAPLAGQIMEVTAPGRRTSYTVVAVDRARGSSFIRVDQGAKFYRSQIEAINGQVVKCRLTVPLGRKKGLDQGFTIANDQRTKFWHADYLGDSSWKLQGAPVTPADFSADHSLTVYEYGPGDQVKVNTQVTVRRVRDGIFAIACTTPCTISFASQRLDISNDQKNWTSGGKQVDDTWTAIDSTPDREVVYVRLGTL